MKAKYKPGTKRGDVHKTFDEAGEKAALTLGAKLGVKPTRLRRWIKSWLGGNDPAPAKKEEKPQQSPTSSTFYVRRGDVYLAKHPELEGRLLRRGEKTSDVQWLNGNVHMDVANAWLGFVEKS